MYLTQLKFSHLKRLADRVDTPLCFLREDGSVRHWTALIGTNQSCKTTLLQAIALAAMGYRRADQLTEGMISAYPDLRRPKGELLIEGEFTFGETFHAQRVYPGLRERPDVPPPLRSTLRLAHKRHLWRGGSAWLQGPEPTDEDPLMEVRSHALLPHWFVAAYGVSRSLPRPEAAPAVQDDFLDRVRPLFGSRQLTATGFADHFGPAAARTFSRVLKRALTAQQGVAPDIVDVELRGSGGARSAEKLLMSHRIKVRMGAKEQKLPAVWLSQGYQSTIAWIADLVGHILKEAEEEVDPEQFEGIVLIDELDLHLHPTWQVGFVDALRETFPKVQFIVTTHSPMVLPGLKADEILLLTEDGERGDILIEAPNEQTRLRSASELLTEFFGIDGLHPTRLARRARDYRHLASNPFRDEGEERKMAVLRDELEAEGLHPAPPVPRRPRA